MHIMRAVDFFYDIVQLDMGVIVSCPLFKSGGEGG